MACAVCGAVGKEFNMLAIWMSVGSGLTISDSSWPRSFLQRPLKKSFVIKPETQSLFGMTHIAAMPQINPKNMRPVFMGWAQVKSAWTRSSCAAMKSTLSCMDFIVRVALLYWPM